MKNFSKLLVSCSSIILNKFVIDNDRKLLYGDTYTVANNLNYYDDKDLGFSFEDLKEKPMKIFIGNIIENKELTKKYFFVASGISNKNLDFMGAVLFKVDVGYLNYKLVPQSNRELLIKDSVELDALSESLYQRLKKFPAITFLSTVIFSNSTLNTITYNGSLNKYLEFEYNPKNLKKSFLHTVYISTCIISLLLIVVFFLFWRIILLPMKESLMMVQKNQNGRKNIDRLFNIFYSLNAFNLKQSALISKQEQEQHEQFAKIISIIFSIGSLSHYITSKIEVLKEDIADMSTKNNKKISSVIDFNKRLRDIEKTVAISEKDIRSLTLEYNKFTKLIKTQNREDICISTAELKSAISSRIEFQNHKTNG